MPYGLLSQRRALEADNLRKLKAGLFAGVPSLRMAPRGYFNKPSAADLGEREDAIERRTISQAMQEVRDLPRDVYNWMAEASRGGMESYNEAITGKDKEGKPVLGTVRALTLLGLGRGGFGRRGLLSGSMRGGSRTQPTADIGKQVKSILKKGAKENLTDKQLVKLAAAPSSFQDVAKWMLPVELGKVLNSRSGVEQVSRLLDVLPSASNMAATAKMGAPKRGWYRASTNALIDVFGPIDSRRFATLLSATSPQNSVEMNLMNTVNIWENWLKAGRPTDAAAIKRVMGQSVAGSKGEQSVLDAWVNNSVRALSAPDPSKVVLSGPKVDSFFNNLVGDVMRVTADAHMANVSGISQDILRMSPSPAQLAKGDPGYSPAYAALSGNVRKGGAKAGMWPAEGQETIWSVGMPLMELQTTLGMPARDILQKGLLTPEMIRGTPDFSTLLNTGEYSDVLRRSGYGDALDKMTKHEWPKTTPSLSIAEQNEVMKTAKRLEYLKGLRGREAVAKQFPSSDVPKAVTGYHQAEYIPGAGIDHAPGLLDAPIGERQRFTSAVSAAMTDPQGLDFINKGIGLSPIKTRGTQGAFDGPAGLEFQPGVAAGWGATPVGGSKPRLSAADEQRAVAAATLRGGMTGQHASPYNVHVRDASGPDITVPREKKMSEDEMRSFMGSPWATDTAVVDTGKGASILNFWEDPITGKRIPFTNAEAPRAGGILNNLEDKKVGGPYLSRNIADPNRHYVDLEKQWMQPPGSRQVTTEMMTELDKLSAKDLRRIDGREIRQVAGDLEKIYLSQAKKGEPLRQDLMNMLSIIKTKGLAGLKAANKPGAFLPSIAALGLLPTVYGLWQQGEETEYDPAL